MAYDEGLAFRVRELLAEQDGLVEKKMFGGVAFMVQGNLYCGLLFTSTSGAWRLVS